MSLLKLVVGAVVKHGGPTLIVWAVLMLLTVMIYKGYGSPLKEDELSGAALLYAVLALVVGQTWSWWRRRRASKPSLVATAKGTSDEPQQK